MTISRRNFLIGTAVAGGGLLVGFSLGPTEDPVPGTVPDSFQPNAWLQITADGRVIFQLHKAEMGQGVMTALPLLLAEELDFDPAGLDIQMAGVHPAFTTAPMGTQITGGSSSLSSSWDTLRHAGAKARAMLLAAAAERLEVVVDELTTEDAVIRHAATGQHLAYQEVAEAAKHFADISYRLKAKSDYRWLGQDVPRLDSAIKSTGQAQYGIDVDVPGMKKAVIVRCPHFGGKLASWQPASVTEKPGVIAAFTVHSGVAIVADSYWQARKAAGQLQVVWDKGPLEGLDSKAMLEAQYAALKDEQPHIVMEKGDITEVVRSIERTKSTNYSVPTAHHSPMEPQNATALYTQQAGGNHCEVWAPNQAPDICRALIAHYGDVSYSNAIVHTTLMGGGFGRRGYPDFVGEVVAIARQMPGTPIQLVWSREDDMQHDFYRPASLHSFTGSVDDNGRISIWRHTLVAPSILRGFGVHIMSAVLPSWVPLSVARSLGKFAGEHLSELDPSKADGAVIPYQVENISIGQVEYDPGVPVGFWRSVGHSYNTFAVESFMDELAYIAQTDPMAFRLQHLAPAARHRGVLELATAKASWGNAPEGISQGLATSEPFNSFCAMVAEVRVEGSSFTVERIVAAVDCGFVVTPDIVKSQIESGIVYALTAALKAPVEFVDGKTAQSNFHDLPVLRMNEVPKMEVYIVDSDLDPSGIGEIGVPAVAPAVANALFAATGQRLRDLPLKLG